MMSEYQKQIKLLDFENKTLAANFTNLQEKRTEQNTHEE